MGGRKESECLKAKELSALFCESLDFNKDFKYARKKKLGTRTHTHRDTHGHTHRDTHGHTHAEIYTQTHTQSNHSPKPVKVKVKVAQSCSTLCNHMDCISPWNSPCQNTRVGSLYLLQGIFPTQGSYPGLPHCRRILYQLSHKGSPRILEWVAHPFSSGSS